MMPDYEEDQTNVTIIDLVRVQFGRRPIWSIYPDGAVSADPEKEEIPLRSFSTSCSSTSQLLMQT